MATWYAIVSGSARDEIIGSTNDSTDTRLVVTDNNSISIRNEGYAQVPITGVTGGAGSGVTITAATLHWFDHSYSQTSKISNSRRIKLSSNNSNYVTVYLDTGTFSSGWKSHQLTSSEFEKLSGSSAWINFEVDDPGGANFRTWEIRSWDYGTGSGISNNDDRYSPYIVIEYDEITISQTRVLLINTII